jgi:pimeloyl-ACP methyl ester carboxylesterase
MLWRPGHKPSLDVVVLLHGFYPLAPGFYGGWIKHLVRRGSTVIYPAYEEVGGDPDGFVADASSGIDTALAALSGRPRSLVIVGYSSGGALALDYTADPGEGVPAPEAVAAVDPAWHLPTGDIPQADLSRVPPSTRMLVIASSELAGEARGLLAAARRVPMRNRELRPFPVDGKEVVMRDGAAVRRALWLPVDRLIATARSGD